LLIEELLAEPTETSAPPPTETVRPTPMELEALHEEAVRKLHQADANDPIGFLAMLLRSRANNDWEAVLRLCRARAEQAGSASERALVAAIAAFRLGRAAEGLAELKGALEDNRRDGALLALQLVPLHAGALRLLCRTLPLIGGQAELADLLEEAAGQLPRSVGAEMLVRTAALVSNAQPERSLMLAQRAADMARGLTSPRW